MPTREPLWHKIVGYLIGGFAVTAFFAAYFGFWYWVSEPDIMTEEAYTRSVHLDNVCRGKALLRFDDKESQDALTQACYEDAWPSYVKPYLLSR